jgi:hypothetical protein
VLQLLSRLAYAASGPGARAFSGSPVMENLSVLLRIPGNKQCLEPGHGTKDIRTLRKFSVARAFP